jgi:adenosylmethionine-8-amino-7-oxononanoate aminotransferase
MPPYCISDVELDQVYDAIRAAADALDSWAAT